ncbi:hypothetical protein B1R32_12336 [Abditibacterium utsteinense]|uniref:Uncharacterized protein n=1 Tax=Abditibacterium utsteinense TaxID=1960156 RepID=A0A2S8SPN1_9BACT|nr:hypothetical protein B1R32_12336 [Abditibacterium utsteinense]
MNCGMAILTQKHTAAQFFFNFFGIPAAHRCKIGVFDGWIDLMHIERHFELIVTAVQALAAQLSHRLSARIAMLFTDLAGVTLAASLFVIDELRCVCCAALQTQECRL